MKELSIKVHEAWLATLMAGFMSKGSNKQKLVNFSDIIFRHFTWVEAEMVAAGVSYDYDREMIPIKVASLGVMLQNIINRLSQIAQELDSVSGDLAHRISHDLKYITFVLSNMRDEEVTAFDANRELDGIELNDAARDALTLFLFEESYKEYELIMIYNYLKANSKDAYVNRIFQILIDESFFHLKSFGDMMAKMGILAVPRMISREVYQIEDIQAFFYAGIDEELAAKEECRKLSEAVSANSPELAKFFDFINNQENYHIALMKDALAYWEKGTND